MRKSLLIVCVCLVSCLTVLAQDGPPRVLLVVREDIKPGMMAMHNRHAASYAGVFGKLQTPNHRIAMIPVAGSENEVLYVTGGESFADIERITRDTDRKMIATSGAISDQLERLEKEAPDMHAAMRDMLAVFRSDLSYKPKVDIPKMRYFAVTTVRIRPGQSEQYEEYVKSLLNPARDKAKAETSVAVYQVVAGSPGTTYMMFRPMKSLAEYDLRIGPRVREAMSDDQRKKADKVASESILFNETSIYAFNPGMSYLPKEFTAGDPAFWNPPMDVAAKPKPKKRAPKPPPTPPAN